MADDSSPLGDFIKKQWKKVSALWEIDEMYTRLQALPIKTREDEKAALALLNEIGSAIVDRVVVVEARHLDNLDAIWRRGKTPEMRAAALDWMFKLGLKHESFAGPVVARTKGLLGKDVNQDSAARIAITRRIGEIGVAHPRSSGFYTLSSLVNSWDEPDGVVQKEKFIQSKAVLNRLDWNEITQPKPLVLTLTRYRSFGIDQGLHGLYAQELLKIMQRKKLQDMKSGLDL